MNTAPPISARIGNAVFRLATALALLLVLLAGINAAAGSYNGSLLLLVLAIAAFAVGRVCRQILAGG
jgi:hypothetical protein